MLDIKIPLRVEQRGKSKVYVFKCLKCDNNLFIWKESDALKHSGMCRSCSRLDRYDKKNETGTKWCNQCQQPVPLLDFYIKKNGRYHSECKYCNRLRSIDYQNKNTEKRKEYRKLQWTERRNEFAEYQKQRRLNYPRQARNSHLKTHYGITIEQYEKLFMEQEGLCAICKKPETKTRLGKLCNLSIDHDHSCCSSCAKCCGKCIRALLCSKCNTALGLLKEDETAIEQLLEYVRTKKINPPRKIGGSG